MSDMLNGITGHIITSGGVSIDARDIQAMVDNGGWLSVYFKGEDKHLEIVDKEAVEMLRHLWRDWHHNEWKLAQQGKGE